VPAENALYSGNLPAEQLFSPQGCGGVDEKGIGDGPSADTTTPPVVAGDPAASSHTMQASPITMPSVVPEL
jgi:hypothetical protein